LNLNFKPLLKMETQKKLPVKFTKQKMIEDINSLRKITMEKKYLKTDLGRLYPSLYCYKVINKLIEIGFLKFVEKKAKGIYYKWNFDSKIDLKLADAIFSSVLEYREFLSKKSSQHRVMRIKKQELIKSQEKANLQVEEPILEPKIQDYKREFSDNCVNDVCCCIEVTEEKLSQRFQMWSPDKQARYLGLVPTEEEIQGWKDQIKDLKNENFKLEREVEKIKNLFNNLQLAFDNYKNKVANHLEPTFIPKEDVKKPFIPVLKEIKKQKIDNQKPTKYLKLFGYMIYEKN